MNKKTVTIIDDKTGKPVAVGQDYPAARDFCLGENGRRGSVRYSIDRSYVPTPEDTLANLRANLQESLFSE